ncbi:MAG TPA: hypothetical protein VEV38_11080, partial [Candidatus Eremiobacteraceae bacterium]|nr:hypothetical protein [Candidatus Eremiobacteraceae bacterium]
STSGFSARGGGPLGYPKTLIDDPFMGALSDAAKAGADELLLGSVIQSSGGQVYYRLTLYRVAPMAFIGSQVFSQAYSGNSGSLVSGISSNLEALAAGHRGTGTIYSTTAGAMADVGTEEGFSVGDTFAVTRNGQQMADATITSIRDDDGMLSISNAVPGYQPAVGDNLTSTKSMPPLPAPPPHSGFNVFALLAAAGGALLAIGHHGQPAVPCTSCATALPSMLPFVILNFGVSGQPPTGTITFTFSQPVNATSQTGISGSQNYASFTLTPGGGTATTPPAPLSAFGSVAFDTTGTIMTLGEQGSGLVTGEGYQITFTTLVTSSLGQPLGPPFTTGPQTFSIFRHGIKIVHPKVGPVAPGPVTPGKPGNPKNPPPGPKPPPANPPLPH